MPKLQTASHKADSIQIGANAGSILGGDSELDDAIRGGKWEDEEERRFFEDIIDLKDYVPKGVLGIDDENKDGAQNGESNEEKAKKEKERVDEEVRKLEEELAGLEMDGQPNGSAGRPGEESSAEGEDEVLNEEDGCAIIIGYLYTLNGLTARSGWPPLPPAHLRSHRPELHNWRRKDPRSFSQLFWFAFQTQRTAH